MELRKVNEEDDDDGIEQEDDNEDAITTAQQLPSKSVLECDKVVVSLVRDDSTHPPVCANLRT